MNQGLGTTFVTKVLLRQPISSFRLVIALFTVTSAVTKLLYDRFLPELYDYNMMRWTIISLGALLFASTLMRFKRRIIVPLFSLLLYLATLLYVIAFVIANRFDPYAVTILILVYGASSVVINSLFYYGIQCVITLLACAIAYLNSGPGNENLIGFLNLLIAMGVFGIVMTVRLKLISGIKNSYSSLEKLNVLSIVANKSGEIVFVSPSIKPLLGYTPNELLKDGWWISNLREGWISRDYILNYPGGVPGEIASIECSLLTKDGKKLWLNWTNSMLPNGNYLGVGFDVTKYKNS
ncbi:MAG: PAS domain S-box protein [Bacteroidetes bacterium]|nr:PAS domain S-box protein [Bacteroidota bacterium]MBI3481435.1 PAS domain S-box protein [Bacteroidota bacterium]